MCPATTALSIKLKVDNFKNNRTVSKGLKELGVSGGILKLYYLTFDLPAMISERFFVKSLRDFQKVVDTLIRESS